MSADWLVGLVYEGGPRDGERCLPERRNHPVSLDRIEPVEHDGDGRRWGYTVAGTRPNREVGSITLTMTWGLIEGASSESQRQSAKAVPDLRSTTAAAYKQIEKTSSGQAMMFKVFISHSITYSDQPFVERLRAYLRRNNATCYLAERDWKFGESLSAKIEQRIKEADCVLAFMLLGGVEGSYVHQELGIASSLGKRCIGVIEAGVSYPPSLEPPCVIIDKNSIIGFAGRLNTALNAHDFEMGERLTLGRALIALIGDIMIR